MGDQNGLVNKYYSSSDCGTLTGGMWYRNATCHAKLVPNRASNLTSSFKITDMASIQKFSDSSCSYEITDTTTYANTQPKNMDRVDYVIASSPPAAPVGHTACTVVAQSKWVSGLPVMGSYYILQERSLKRQALPLVCQPSPLKATDKPLGTSRSVIVLEVYVRTVVQVMEAVS